MHRQKFNQRLTSPSRLIIFILRAGLKYKKQRKTTRRFVTIISRKLLCDLQARQIVESE